MKLLVALSVFFLFLRYWCLFFLIPCNSFPPILNNLGYHKWSFVYISLNIYFTARKTGFHRYLLRQLFLILIYHNVISKIPSYFVYLISCLSIKSTKQLIRKIGLMWIQIKINLYCGYYPWLVVRGGWVRLNRGPISYQLYRSIPAQISLAPIKCLHFTAFCRQCDVYINCMSELFLSGLLNNSQRNLQTMCF